jgi:hypothetical protein
VRIIGFSFAVLVIVSATRFDSRFLQSQPIIVADPAAGWRGRRGAQAKACGYTNAAKVATEMRLLAKRRRGEQDRPIYRRVPNR